MLDAALDWSNKTELVGLVFTVTSKQDLVLYPDYAKGLHAWFLNQVRQDDPDFSQYLHDGQSAKLFTVSSHLSR